MHVARRKLISLSVKESSSTVGNSLPNSDTAQHISTQFVTLSLCTRNTKLARSQHLITDAQEPSDDSSDEGRARTCVGRAELRNLVSRRNCLYVAVVLRFHYFFSVSRHYLLGVKKKKMKKNRTSSTVELLLFWSTLTLIVFLSYQSNQPTRHLEYCLHFLLTCCFTFAFAFIINLRLYLHWKRHTHF